MLTSEIPPRATVTFLGKRAKLLAIMVSGYLLMIMSAGIYRFWLVTNKRRFYWAHTEINGEALEYTGTPVQLLVGFLFAVFIFLPLYGFFFYLSTQSPEAAVIGYIAAAGFLYFLFGYAAFRGRRFLLSRTLWRGIRFQLSGSAWGYAFRRFFWTSLSIATLGLAFPFMSASLWKYRYGHTWFGDRRFGFSGSWRNIAPLYYSYYFVIAGLIAGGIYFEADETLLLESLDVDFGLSSAPISSVSILLFSGALFIAYSAYFHLKAHITSTMLSSISIGRTKLEVKVKARSLFGLQVVYSFWLLVIVVGFLMLVGFVLGEIIEPLFSDSQTDLSEILQLGWYNLAIFGLIYLGFMAALAIVSELILRLGFWRIVARGTILENVGELSSIRAGGQESPLAGEGIADALNAGAY